MCPEPQLITLHSISGFCEPASLPRQRAFLGKQRRGLCSSLLITQFGPFHAVPYLLVPVSNFAGFGECWKGRLCSHGCPVPGASGSALPPGCPALVGV